MHDIPSPGTVFGRKYRVEHALGQGGMSVVVAARRLLLDDVVAVKFLLPDHCKKSELVARFLREARAAAKLRSERAARVFDVDTLDDGTPFIVMELLEGQDLEARLLEGGALAVHEAVGIVLQACEVLAEAHEAGIVHRDLKPANLFVVMGSDGIAHVKVLDFGISKVRDAGFEAPLTSAEALIGSPAYMSPEQIANAADVDARADIWALGVILYELVTARRPFEAEGLPALLLRIVSQPSPDLCALDPLLPAELGAITKRCLEKRAEDRFHDVAELAAALSALGSPDAARSLARIRGTATAQRSRTKAPAVSAQAKSAQAKTNTGRARKATAPKGQSQASKASKPLPENTDRVRTGVRDTGAQPQAGDPQSGWSQSLVAALKGQHLTIKLTAKQIDMALAARDSRTAAVLLRRLREAIEAHTRLEDLRLYPELRRLAARSGDPEMVALVSEFSAGMADIGVVLTHFFERHADAVDLTEARVEWPDVHKALAARLSAEETSLYPLHQELAVAIS